jgi:hypothetical protein
MDLHMELKRVCALARNRYSKLAIACKLKEEVFPEFNAQVKPSFTDNLQ